MRKTITVNELRKQLDKLIINGYGNAEVWFRDWADIDHEVEKGVIDTDVDEKFIVIG